MANDDMTNNTDTANTPSTESATEGRSPAAQSGVARVEAIQGEVSVRNSQSTQSLAQGQIIHLNDTVLTAGASVLVLTFHNGTVVTLGQDQQLTLDQRLVALLEDVDAEDSIEGTVDFDRLAQALEEGQSLDELLPTPAAGEDGAVSTGSDSIEGGIRIAYTGERVTPTSGFETEGLQFNQSIELYRPEVGQFTLGGADSGTDTGGSGTGGSGTVTPPTPPPPPAPDFNTASFTDNFVNGVTYTTSSGLTGLTGDQGEPGSFAFRAGDTITFTVGDVTVAQFSADAIQNGLLFLQDIVGTDLSDNNTNYLENMAIFLQALDDDLQDSTPGDGILQTNDLQNLDASYASNINITQAVRDALTGYIDPTTGEPLNLATAGKQMLSEVLDSLGIEFTRESEMDSSGSGANLFESQAMEHVADTIQELAGDRAPDAADERQVDTIDVPGGTVRYNYSELDGEITFNTSDLLAGAVGQQVITANLLVKNVQLSADYQDIGTIEDRGNGNYAIVLNDGYDQYDLEGLTLDYRVEDWTAFKEVTSSTQDTYKSHLSADINDVNEGDGFNQFTLNSELSFDTDSILNINFTSENLSAALGYQIAEYTNDYLVPLEYSNDGGATWQV
ncbi:retention module-containing protein, partial [Pseudomaricurvus sp.]|uniref:retention module-containing protein n=1 Tax=Pseudomaricurvus sp. TaxID=2004510 RepID=UPI003F6BA5BA